MKHSCCRMNQKRKKRKCNISDIIGQPNNNTLFELIRENPDRSELNRLTFIQGENIYLTTGPIPPNNLFTVTPLTDPLVKLNPTQGSIQFNNQIPMMMDISIHIYNINFQAGDNDEAIFQVLLRKKNGPTLQLIRKVFIGSGALTIFNHELKINGNEIPIYENGDILSVVNQTFPSQQLLHLYGDNGAGDAKGRKFMTITIKPI